MLAEALLKADPRGRQQILVLLGESGQQALAAPVFAKMLLTGDASLRYDALIGLRKLGKEGVPALLEGLQSATVEVRRDAATGLYDLVQAARRERERIADDQDPTAADAKLKGILEALKQAQPALTKALGDPDVELRLNVAKAIYQASGDLDQALPPMLARSRTRTPRCARPQCRPCAAFRTNRSGCSRSCSRRPKTR